VLKSKKLVHLPKLDQPWPTLPLWILHGERWTFKNLTAVIKTAKYPKLNGATEWPNVQDKHQYLKFIGYVYIFGAFVSQLKRKGTFSTSNFRCFLNYVQKGHQLKHGDPYIQKYTKFGYFARFFRNLNCNILFASKLCDFINVGILFNNIVISCYI
jgi:hypothetical protein